MKDKQDELELSEQGGSYNLIGIGQSWWNDSHDRNAVIEVYNVFKRNRSNKKGGGIKLCVLKVSRPAQKLMNLVIVWRVKITGGMNKSSIITAVYYHLPK